jgi:hypothetical protein
MLKKHHQTNAKQMIEITMFTKHWNNTQITNTKLSTLEANFPMFMNEIGVKHNTEFGVFMKHPIDPMLTKQRTYH